MWVCHMLPDIERVLPYMKEMHHVLRTKCMLALTARLILEPNALRQYSIHIQRPVQLNLIIIMNFTTLFMRNLIK